MASEESRETVEIRAPLESNVHWVHGALAGLLAAIAMGIAISLIDVSVLRNAIAGLYGLEGSLAVGWVAHLVHGTLFGFVFAAVLSDPILYRVSEWPWKTVLAGAIYGLVLALAGAGLIMPIWLTLVGVEPTATVPNVTGETVLYHLVFGGVLGSVYAALDRDSERGPD